MGEYAHPSYEWLAVRSLADASGYERHRKDATRNIKTDASGYECGYPSLTLFDVARFYPNPKRQRGILLRSPQSENPPRRLIERHGRVRTS